MHRTGVFLLVCAGLLCLLPAAASAQAPPYLYQLGTYETIQCSAGVAVDGGGNVYVSDLGNCCILKFSSNGTYITKWGTQGTGNGEFFGPCGVAVDASDHVYVVDRENSRVQKFTSNGTYVTKWGTQGTGNGQFYWPHGVMVDGGGNVYVTDLASRIQKFTSNGTFVTAWSSYQDQLGHTYEYNFAWGMAMDGSGGLYVADKGNDRILAPWGVLGGTQGYDPGQLTQPTGVALDGSGNIYVVDESSRVQVFTSSGAFVTQWSGDFNVPYGVAVASNGNVYVTSVGGPVCVYGSLPVPTQSTSWGRIKALYH